MTEQDLAWHDSFKPRFTTDGGILYRTSKPKQNHGWRDKPVAGDGGAMVVNGRPQRAKVSTYSYAKLYADILAAI